jgi:hypothetical protein
MEFKDVEDLAKYVEAHGIEVWTDHPTGDDFIVITLGKLMELINNAQEDKNAQGEGVDA